MIVTPPAERLKALQSQRWKIVHFEYALPSVQRIGYSVLWLLARDRGADEERINFYS